MRRFITIAVLLSVSPVVAHADGPPRYDVEAHCKEVANFGGSYSASLDNACLEQEQNAYDGLKANWAEVPIKAREHCDEIARFGGHGSYNLLQACIQQEVKARGTRPKFRY